MPSDHVAASAASVTSKLESELAALGDPRVVEHGLSLLEVPSGVSFKHRVSDFPGGAITDEGTWDDTWAEVMRYGGLYDEFRYDCWQSIYRRDA